MRGAFANAWRGDSEHPRGRLPARAWCSDCSDETFAAALPRDASGSATVKALRSQPVLTNGYCATSASRAKSVQSGQMSLEAITGYAAIFSDGLIMHDAQRPIGRRSTPGFNPQNPKA